ncbi:MAG: capsular biosynthesis protein [Hyphomicrobium sp.]|nr:capsular biosynthesis protein [Hyphomicrobium sp.]
MIDLHCHMLPGLDDGAPDLATALAMARMFAADGVTHVACTPHILPGLYHNTGDQIRAAVGAFDAELRNQDIDLAIFPGADAHMTPAFIQGLRSGHIPTLGASRYVLVEPPHHTVPQRIEQFFFDILVAGYVPILTHPERLRWINDHYAIMQRLAAHGVWMQLTAASVTGAFGKNAQYWSERMLDEGLVHVLASDAHDVHRRIPNLSRGRDAAAKRLGDVEARHLVITRPWGILSDEPPNAMPAPPGLLPSDRRTARPGDPRAEAADGRDHPGKRGWASRLRNLFE